MFVFGQECLILKFISVFPLHNYVLYFKGLIFICLFLFFLHSASKVTIVSLLGICTSYQNPLNSQLSGGKFTVLISGADPLSSKCGNLYSNFLIALCRARAKGKCGIPRSKSRGEKVPLKILNTNNKVFSFLSCLSIYQDAFYLPFTFVLIKETLKI